mmetsp:Transcript_14671/g.44780  ORF Transcript_14671/g.44780 Transcript_14671/m.44780 type:complete len:279 (+) Transcript_14671:1323-2159(+)
MRRTLKGSPLPLRWSGTSQVLPRSKRLSRSPRRLSAWPRLWWRVLASRKPARSQSFRSVLPSSCCAPWPKGLFRTLPTKMRAAMLPASSLTSPTARAARRTRRWRLYARCSHAPVASHLVYYACASPRRSSGSPRPSPVVRVPRRSSNSSAYARLCSSSGPRHSLACRVRWLTPPDSRPSCEAQVPMSRWHAGCSLCGSPRATQTGYAPQRLALRSDAPPWLRLSDCSSLCAPTVMHACAVSRRKATASRSRTTHGLRGSSYSPSYTTSIALTRRSMR